MRLPLAARWAWRDLRGGIAGFRLFIACLALGVAAIAAAGSTAQAFRAGLAANAREILGGDIAVSVGQRPFTTRERAIMAARGSVAYAAAVQAMASAASGARELVELRGVSDGYPLAGHVVLAGGANLRAALRPAVDGRGVRVWGAAVESSLLRRLSLRLGDRFAVGNVPVVARAVLLSEPDRLSRGFALGPRVMLALAAVEGGGFLSPGPAVRRDRAHRPAFRRAAGQGGQDGAAPCAACWTRLRAAPARRQRRRARCAPPARPTRVFPRLHRLSVASRRRFGRARGGGRLSRAADRRHGHAESAGCVGRPGP